MDLVEQVKSSVDIVKVIGEYVPLKKAGGTARFVGRCPFHNEKTPSFSVHASHQFYKCFGCGAGGDVLKFVMEIERISFFEALKLLAERNGIPVPKRNEYSDPDSKRRAALLEMHDLAAKLFQANLHGPSGGDARAYLANRGVTPAQAQEFGLGLAADGWDQLVRRLQSEKFTAEQLDESGLVSRRQDGSGHYDRFRARLIFPIHNESGQTIGFGGRALKTGDEPKYLNSPETPLYHKTHVLYNLHRAKDAIRKHDRVVLVEGYMDAIGVFSVGVREVVASCGTALTNTQVRALKRQSDKVVVNFDPDAAGANASERSIQMLLEEGMRVKVLELDGGLDPDEYVKQHGADVYRQKLQSAAGFFHWLADRARKKFDMRSAEGRIAGLKFLLPAIQRVSDKLERATIAEDLASYLGVQRGLVLEEFRKVAAGGGERRAAPRSAGVPATEKLLLNLVLGSAEARAQTLPRLRELRVYGQFVSQRIFEALWAATEGAQAFQFADLESRLNENDRDLLAAVVFADEMNEDGKALEQATECLRALETQDRELHRAALRERVKQAERGGNFDEALRLMQELDCKN
jgi:DNA primase